MDSADDQTCVRVTKQVRFRAREPVTGTIFLLTELESVIPVCVCVCVCVCVLVASCVQLFATPRTVALQAPLSMEFSRQEYWSGLPFPSLGHLPDPGIEHRFA